MSWPLSHKVLLIFLTILHDISSREWVNHCLARCCWICEHLAWHFIQLVSWLLPHKMLLNFWPSCMTFGPVGESTIILQDFIVFVTISHDISSSLWVNHHVIRWCWICDHLTWYFMQSVSQPSSGKMLFTYWSPDIIFCPVGESTTVLHGVIEFLTIWHYTVSSWWVDHCHTMCCWNFDHLAPHFSREWVNHCITRCCWNFLQSCIIFYVGSESTIVSQDVVVISDHLTWHFI